MTILCITTTGLPGIRPCTHRGQHRVTCPDHEGWREDLRPGECWGCLPRSADRGFLCHACYDRVDDAYMRWRDFARLVLETDGRAVSADGGGIKGPTPDGYTNLPLTVLALDECTRLLRSQAGRTLDAWVHTEDGARDAIMFAHAAHRAYRSLEVEKRELQLERVRCPHCGLLSLSANPTRSAHGVTVVECQHCGELLDRIRDDSPRWVGSETCETGDHADCASLHCRCECHDLGWRAAGSTQYDGTHALWNADLHTIRPNTTGRDLWIIDDTHTIRRAETERKIA